MYIDPNDHKEIENAVLEGMARGPWVDYWASKEEGSKSFSGTDIYELAPSTPAWAKKWARKVAAEIVKLNQAKLGVLSKLGKTTIAHFANLIHYAYPEKKRPDYEKIGFWLGCQAAGMGIGWTDDLPYKAPFSLKIPQIEFYRR